MIELPEAAVLAGQINQTLTGKRIKKVIAAHSPHKFAWYAGDPQKYNDSLAGKMIGRAESFGGFLEIRAGDTLIGHGDGANLRYYQAGERFPDRHQLFVEFGDGSALAGTIQMYGGFYVFPPGTRISNKYYLIAKEKPSPLAAGFDRAYFEALFEEGAAKLSLKAFLATEQRIPGLGNGVLQDILFDSGMHPRRKAGTLTADDRRVLLNSLKSILAEMVAKGGRDTEKDLFGNFGRYKTALSKNTSGRPCPVCGTAIVKEAYLGGSVYYCKKCQRID